MAVEQNTTKSSNSMQALPWTSNWQSPVKTETKIALGEISGEINNIWVSGYITCYFDGTTTNPKVVEFTNFPFNSRLKDSFYVVNKEWTESEIKEHIDAELLFGEDHKLYLNQLQGYWAGARSGDHINGTITINRIDTSYVKLEPNFKYQDTPSAEKIFYNYVTTDTADFDDLFARIGTSDACCYDCEDLFGDGKYKNNNKNLKYLSIDDTPDYPWIKKAENISYYNINQRYTITQDIEHQHMNKAIIKGTTPRPFSISTSGDNINVTGPAKELYSTTGAESDTVYIYRDSDNMQFNITNHKGKASWLSASAFGLNSLPWCITCVAWGAGGAGGTKQNDSKNTNGTTGGGGGAFAVFVLDFTKQDAYKIKLPKGASFDNINKKYINGGSTIISAYIDSHNTPTLLTLGSGNNGYNDKLQKDIYGIGGKYEIRADHENYGLYILSAYNGGSGGHLDRNGDTRNIIQKSIFKTYSSQDYNIKLSSSAGGKGRSQFEVGTTFVAGGGAASVGEGGNTATVLGETDGTPGYFGGGGAGVFTSQTSNPNLTAGGDGGIIFLY